MIDYDGKECYRMIDKIFLELRGQKKSFRAEDFVAIFESPGMGLGVCGWPQFFIVSTYCHVWY